MGWPGCCLGGAPKLLLAPLTHSPNPCSKPTPSPSLVPALCPPCIHPKGVGVESNLSFPLKSPAQGSRLSWGLQGRRRQGW